MPSGKPVDWSKYDHLLYSFLPGLTIKEFGKKYIPCICARAIGVRARKLNIKPLRYSPTKEHREAISIYKSKQATPEQVEYVITNANKVSRVQLALDLGISFHLIDKIAKENRIIFDKQKSAEFQADASKKHISRANAASVAKWQDEAFKSRQSDLISERNRALWQSSSYRSKVSSAITSALAKPEVRKKISESSKKSWLDDNYRNRMADVRAAQSGHLSKIQAMLYAYLDELGVEYHKEGERTRIGFYVFDCLVLNNNKKLLIECQGDYWHSSTEAERRDKGKFTYIDQYFSEYEIMYIWEHEFYCKNRVLDRLKLKLGIDIETKEFKFSDLILRPINGIETKTFLDLYHYLGRDRGGKAFGAFDGDLLVAAVVFSPPLRQNTAGQFGLIDGEVRELSRLCIHPSYHKKNFASWFIKRVLKQIKCKLIVAYADTTVGHTGGIYKASNFELHHIVPADYWYVDTQGYIMHKRTLYGKAKSLNMTENEFALAKGYIRKYGGEKLCFVYRLH
ncbi:MAG: hypothetical protein WC919_00510 [Candidatus Paceibacterota bacterium]|jgi:hypothetical protein